MEFINHLEDQEYSDDDEEEASTFSKAERRANQEIYKLAKHMILKSQTLKEAVFYPRRDLNESHYGGNFHLSILTIADQSGNTPLHTLCSYSSDPTMMKIILENCPSESVPIGSATAYDLVSYRNAQGCTPLHFVAEGGPFSSLKLMLQYCRPSSDHGTETVDARLIADDDGDLPLHWAFSGAVSPRRLRALLNGCQESLLYRNDEGCLPMYQFVTEHCDMYDFQGDDDKRNLWNEMQGMLKAVTDTQDDDDTWSPLHAIASGVHFIPKLFWSIATEFCENGTYNSDGMLPLHVAVSTTPVEYRGVTDPSSDNPGRHLMKEILLSDLELVRRPTSQGRLALHLASESQQPEWVIHTLRKAFPDALLTFDPVTGLPPSMLAAVEENNSLTTVYELLRIDPSILLVRR